MCILLKQLNISIISQKRNPDFIKKYHKVEGERNYTYTQQQIYVNK